MFEPNDQANTAYEKVYTLWKWIWPTSGNDQTLHTLCCRTAMLLIFFENTKLFPFSCNK